MDNIIEPTIDFDFSKLYLGTPSALTGGAYFTRIFLNNKPLFIQTPKCQTKQGFIKSGKKIYVDLMFDNNDSIFIHWIENLESQCQKLIYEKGEGWFQTKLEKDDIETAFTSPIKIFKSGKFYLVRVNIKPHIKIYNESDEIIPLEDVTNDANIISILEIQGIKFTSRNFQIELELKQSMMVSPDPFLESCFIKKPVSSYKKPELNATANTSSSEKTNATTKEVSPLVENTLSVEETHTNTATSVTVNTKVDLEDFIQDSVKDLQKYDTEQETTPTEPAENILLEIEDLNEPEEKTQTNELTEMELNNVDPDSSLETMTLKKPTQVYYEIYQKAKEKANQAKKDAILAYLEVKNIKKTYRIKTEEEESDSEFDNMSDMSEPELENVLQTFV